MRKLICTLFAVTVFSMASYAGQWQQDENGWRYQKDEGTYVAGWYQDSDGKWYYFDDQTNYMLTDTTTPDGYRISVDGVWEGESAIDTEKNNGYENVVEVSATACDMNPAPVEQLGYSLPINVYYNNEYDISSEGTVKVTGIGVSEEGVAYVKLNVKLTEGYRGKLKLKYRFTLEDGTYVDSEESCSFYSHADEFDTNISLMSEILTLKNNQIPVSADIWIEEGSLY